MSKFKYVPLLKPSIYIKNCISPSASLWECWAAKDTSAGAREKKAIFFRLHFCYALQSFKGTASFQVKAILKCSPC